MPNITAYVFLAHFSIRDTACQVGTSCQLRVSGEIRTRDRVLRIARGGNFHVAVTRRATDMTQALILTSYPREAMFLNTVLSYTAPP